MKGCLDQLKREGVCYNPLRRSDLVGHTIRRNRVVKGLIEGQAKGEIIEDNPA